jgi:LAO/AO transport system kinase
MNLSLKPHLENEWRPPVLKTIAIKGEGVAEVVDWVGKHHAYLQSSGLLKTREKERWGAVLEDVLQRQLMKRALEGMNGSRMDSLVDKIAAREMDVYSAADKLMEDGQ